MPSLRDKHTRATGIPDVKHIPDETVQRATVVFTQHRVFHRVSTPFLSVRITQQYARMMIHIYIVVVLLIHVLTADAVGVIIHCLNKHICAIVIKLPWVAPFYYW